MFLVHRKMRRRETVPNQTCKDRNLKVGYGIAALLVKSQVAVNDIIFYSKNNLDAGSHQILKDVHFSYLIGRFFETSLR